ncbi:DUF402 domain-containing protein [Actinomycetes bacterium KLBMP 9759]
MTAVRIVFSKWDGARHWEYDGVRLGVDEHGTWVGARNGTPVSRPGAAFTSSYDYVALLPPAGFAAAFYEDVPSAPFSIYVDICTPPTWCDGTAACVDLDLDVIKDRSGRIWVDDEDEFVERQELLSYPPPIIAEALRTCDEVHEAMLAGAAPFDGATGARWLDVLAATAS